MAKIDWFDKIDISSCLLAGKLVLNGREGRKHDDAHIGVFSDIFGENQAVLVGETDIKYCNTIGFCKNMLIEFVCCTYPCYLIPIKSKVFHHTVKKGFVIFYDNNWVAFCHDIFFHFFSIHDLMLSAAIIQWKCYGRCDG